MNITVVVTTVVVAALILFFDLSLPLGVAGGVPYVALVLLGIWFPNTKHIVLLALLGTALTVAGFVMSPKGGIEWVVITNRGLALFAIWISAGLLVHVKKGQEQLLRNEKELRRHIENSEMSRVSLEQQASEIVKLAEELYAEKARAEKLSVTDRLTGLFNRLKLDEALIYELERAKRYGHPLSIILFDIDHFKQVNDTFGHKVGDDVLASIAKVAAKKVRAIDIVGRWGGEEFMVICPETDLPSARAVAERIRTGVAAHSFPSVGRKTASFGVATVLSKDNADAITRRADEALYRAKKGGRNRVETAA